MSCLPFLSLGFYHPLHHLLMGTGMCSLLMDLPVHSLDFLCQSHFDTSLDNNLCKDQSKKLQVITGNSSFFGEKERKIHLQQY